ncbi:MAG: DUF3303 family protein [Nitrososphaeraceae archaeon]
MRDCPLYNSEARKALLQNYKDSGPLTKEHNLKFLQQYHSKLEHTLIWIVEANNAHDIENLIMKTIGNFNTVRIIPLITFQNVIESCKKKEGS